MFLCRNTENYSLIIPVSWRTEYVYVLTPYRAGLVRWFKLEVIANIFVQKYEEKKPYPKLSSTYLQLGLSDLNTGVI